MIQLKKTNLFEFRSTHFELKIKILKVINIYAFLIFVKT